MGDAKECARDAKASGEADPPVIEPPARQAEAKVQQVIEETLTEHGLNFTRYEGAHGRLPGSSSSCPVSAS